MLRKGILLFCVTHSPLRHGGLEKEGQIIHVHEKRRILTPAAAPLPESRPLAHVSSSSGVFGYMLLVLLFVMY